jgi:NAD(P)-dependent dehydrogenase (short-subunit alcohol dehydrogenase family)
VKTLPGRVALVTGAAQGLGRAAARALAAEGATVALVDRDREGLAAAEVEAAREGVPTLSLVADLADPEAAQRAVESAAARLGRLDVLVSAAGVLDVEPVMEVTAAAWSASRRRPAT